MYSYIRVIFMSITALVHAQLHIHVYYIKTKVKRYEEDSLTHCGMMKPAWTASMIDSMALASQLLYKIALPALLIHGARDPIVNYSSTEFVYGQISSEDKTFLVCM